MMEHDSLNAVNSINFDEIEPEKENILPLKDGRSAQSLTQALRQDGSQISSIRVTFERRLLDELEDMDDPLELFMEYITWINDAFPQGGNSTQSGMLEVIERCLMYFRDIETYKNDPRLLKVWLWYIELFSPNSAQESKDIFVYMLRKRIGCKLSLFYEEFATLLFEMGKYKEAHHIMKMGIEENARPQSRLLKRLEEYETKLRDMNIEIHNGTQVDVQYLEINPSSLILGRERSSVILNTAAPSTSTYTNVPKDDALKYEIFNDDKHADNSNEELRINGWDVLDSRSSRSKENRMNAAHLVAGSNLGKLDQESDALSNTKRKLLDKLPIFKDDLGRSDPIYKIVQVPGKKDEKIDCNFDLIYPKTGEEYCIEEVLAMSRNLYYKRDVSYPKTDQVKRDEPGSELQNKKRRKILAPLGEKTPERAYFQPQVPSCEPPKHGSINEHKSITKTSILPLKNAPEQEQTNHNQIRKDLQSPHSPTVTFFSKDAMNEVYSMFNQHYEESKHFTENDETTNKFALFDNFTQEFTRQHIDDLTEVKTIESGHNANVGGNMNRSDGKVPSEVKISDRQEIKSSIPTYKSKLKEYMTPIQEKIENNLAVVSENSNKDGNSQFDADTRSSSPFLTQPQQEIYHSKDIGKTPVIENPLGDNFRKQLLATIDPPLDRYDTFYHYNQSLKMSALLKKIHRVSKSENKNPIVDFKKTGDLYCIRSELGEGGYATVYLAESSTGNLSALKVEKPASVWEYYILKQIEKRLSGRDILRSIINASSLHCFQDESYLVLNYANQGTVLDLINLQKEKSKGPLDELLCMFITAELMKVMEAIHDIGIIHGDLKPDNCMIRFKTGNLGPYHADGSRGWSNKGIYLIDFGRSFDMRLLQPLTKFKANWKTDQQDCYEMRENEPWSYEADYYGLAGIVHAMLFGEIIETVKLQNGRFKLKNAFKRYWRQDIWSSIFDILLNSGKLNCFPITSKIVERRWQIETYLTNNSSGKLKSIILDLEAELTHLRR